MYDMYVCMYDTIFTISLDAEIFLGYGCAYNKFKRLQKY